MKKTGAELFREVIRFWPEADIEDYYKMGVWKDDLMRLDLALLSQHRIEAGAPDPPPLDEIPKPTVAARAGVPAVAAKPGGNIRPMLLVQPGPVKAGETPAPSMELRLMALFVARWKLNPTQTKALLGKLSKPRQRYVLQNFKVTEESGADSTAALEKFIEECEEKDLWADAEKAAEKEAEESKPETGAPPPKGVVLAAGAPTVSATGVVTAKGVVPAKPVVAVKPVVPAKALVPPKPGSPVTPGAVAPRPAGMIGAAGLKRPVPALNPGALDPAKRPKAGAIVMPGNGTGI